MAPKRDFTEEALRVRELAASTGDPELRQQLVVVAEDYDHMADVANRIATIRRKVGVARLRPRPDFRR